jgi:hypothetical protein
MLRYHNFRIPHSNFRILETLYLLVLNNQRPEDSDQLQMTRIQLQPMPFSRHGINGKKEID